MKTVALGDKLSIGLSELCTIHCLAQPFLLTLVPSLIALQLEGETFHILMAVLVIPISLYWLIMGCIKHKRFYLLILGWVGLGCVVIAIALGEKSLGEFAEKMLVFIGSGLIASSHWFNFRLSLDEASQHSHCDDS